MPKTIEQVKEYLKQQIEFNDSSGRRDCIPWSFLDTLNKSHRDLLDYIDSSENENG